MYGILKLKILNIVDHWVKDHPEVFSDIVFEYEGPAARVNIGSKVVYLNPKEIYRISNTYFISLKILTYYILSHELGHLLYQKTDKSVDEEIYAHRYGHQDALIRLNLNPGSINLSLIEQLESKLLQGGHKYGTEAKDNRAETQGTGSLHIPQRNAKE